MTRSTGCELRLRLAEDRQAGDAVPQPDDAVSARSAIRILRAIAVVALAFGSLGASTLSKFAWVDELKSHIERCWRVPAGFDGSSGLEIRVTFELNRDGTLARDPVASTISRPHPMGAVVAKSVVDAIKRCQPYSFLPAEQYTNGWDNLEITFTITPTAATDPGQDGPSWLRDSAKQELRKQKSNKDTGN